MDRCLVSRVGHHISVWDLSLGVTAISTSMMTLPSSLLSWACSFFLTLQTYKPHHAKCFYIRLEWYECHKLPAKTNSTTDHCKHRHKMDKTTSELGLPGFRFHPTEEELLDFYLRKMVLGKKQCLSIIGFLNIYHHEPWDLPGNNICYAVKIVVLFFTNL